MVDVGACAALESPPIRRVGLRRIRTAVAVAVTISLVLRAVFFSASMADPQARQLTSDSIPYLLLGDNLARGLGFGRELEGDAGPAWYPELFRTPGYPLLLAALELGFGDAQTGIVVLQHVLGVVLVGTLTVVAGSAFGPMAAWGVGLFAALDIQGVILANLVLSESVYGFLLLMGALSVGRLLRRPSVGGAILCGLLLGSSAMVRPTSIALPTLLGLLFLGQGLWRRRRDMLLAGLLVGLVGNAIVCGWILRNGRMTGEYVLSTVPRGQLIFCHVAETLAWSRGEKSRDAAYRELCDRLDLRSEELMLHALPRAKNAEVRALALDTIRAHPRAFAVNFALKTANTLFSPDKRASRILGTESASLGILNPRGSSRGSSTVFLGLLAFQGLHLLLLWGLVLGTLWRMAARGEASPLLVACLVMSLYVLALSVGPPGDPRYRWPVVPLLALLAAPSMNRGLARFGRRTEALS